MNRHKVAGIVADLAAGRRVLVVCQDVRASRDAFYSIAAAAISADLDDDLVVRRANGSERIGHPNGGVVLFRSRRQLARGLSADVIVLDFDASDDELAELLPVIAASPIRELIRP